MDSGSQELHKVHQVPVKLVIKNVRPVTMGQEFVHLVMITISLMDLIVFQLIMSLYQLNLT